MLACLDAQYSERATAAACVLFRQWIDSEPAAERVRLLPAAPPYRPGWFYERELPALLAVRFGAPPGRSRSCGARAGGPCG